MRFGIAQRVLIGMIAPAALVGLALLLGLGRLNDVHVRFNQISDEELPSLIRVHELERETNRMAALSAEIVTARSDHRFKSIQEQVAASLEAGRALTQALYDGAFSAEAHTIAGQFEAMAERLNGLIELRNEQRDLEERAQRIYRRLTDLANEVNEGVHTHSAPPGEAPSDATAPDWHLLINRALGHLRRVRDTLYPENVAAAAEAFLQDLREAQAELDRMPAPHRPAAALIQAELLDYGTGPAGLFALRTREIRLARTLDGSLGEVQLAAAALLGSSSTLYQRTRNSVIAHDASVQSGILRFRHALIAIGLLTLFVLLWAYVDLRRSLIRRLLAMQGVLHANIGQATHTPVPLEGHDELTLMAQEVNYFLGEIGRREDALRQAAERERAASRARGEFLANMSHEIRTPLNSIINLTGLCLRADLPERQRDRMEKVAQSGASLLGLINDILDFSKIDAGRMSLEERPFRLDEVLQAFTPQVEEATRKGLAFQVECAPDLPQALRGDLPRIRQVLLNLVGNAIKFTHQGHVLVQVRAQPRTAETRWIEFLVEDTGIGIEADQQGRIFEIFEQGDSSTSRRYGGTGLGLAIGRRLAEAMGGSLEVESQAGVGSRFRLRLPLHPVEPAQVPSHPQAEDGVSADRMESLDGTLVLVVEDNPFNQQVTQELLERSHALADLAETGAQAVAMASAVDYDLILMDIHMPGMDGLAATRAIRTLPGRGRTPIIAVTADALSETRTECLAAGMNDMVIKPINAPEFYATLLRWLNGGEAAPRPTPSPGDDASETRPPLEVGADPTPGGLTDAPGLLAAFDRYHADTPAHLREAVGAGDLVLAHRLAHNLKSAARTLRADGLAEQAQALEALLKGAMNEDKGPEGVEALLDRTDEALAAILGRVRGEGHHPTAGP